MKMRTILTSKLALNIIDNIILFYKTFFKMQIDWKNWKIKNKYIFQDFLIIQDLNQIALLLLCLDLCFWYITFKFADKELC